MTFNKKILRLLVVLSVLFLSLCVYLTYFQLFQSSTVAKSSYNRRLWEQESNVLRGSIIDRNGIVLANSSYVGEEQTQVREYPYQNLYAHLIGYNSQTYGKSRLELEYNEYLNGSSDVVTEALNLLAGKEAKGATLHLTVDHNLQKIASDAMGNRNGAAIAIDPRTGEVLAMVSKPDFNPSEVYLNENWTELSESENSPFLTRATSGLYSPGSTFKPIIAVAAIENGLGNTTYTDEGSVIIDGKVFKNTKEKAYGDLDISSALSVSSNVVFTQLAVSLGEDDVRDIINRFYIGEKIDFDLSCEPSRFSYSSMGQTDLAAVGIGQGKLQVTPLQMALVASTIANDGTMMKPYLVDEITSADGINVQSTRPKAMTTSCSASVANQVTDMMVECVESGTGTGAKISGVTVAGKTGTAENETDKDHSWFIAFAPAENPTIAVAVLLEYDGSGGGTSCAPIAQKMMNYWLNER